ncbi:MAG: hypothetical protein WKF41_12955 [Gaiellaceae bacterium]
MLRFFEALFVAVSAIAAAFAVHEARISRAADHAEAWRRENEDRLRALAAALVGVGEASIRWREQPGRSDDFEVAQLRLRQAFTDALNPWIEIDVIADACGEPPEAITTDLIEDALNDVNNAIDRVREEARKSHRERRRELKQLLRK